MSKKNKREQLAQRRSMGERTQSLGDLGNAWLAKQAAQQPAGKPAAVRPAQPRLGREHWAVAITVLVVVMLVIAHATLW